MGEPEPFGPDALRYLADAERALGGAAPDERREVLAALREHIALWCRDVGLDPEHCPYEELVAELGPPADLAEHGPEPARLSAEGGIPPIPGPADETRWDPWNHGGAGEMGAALGGLAAAADRRPVPPGALGRAEASLRRAAAGVLRLVPRGHGAADVRALALRLRSALAAVPMRPSGARRGWAGFWRRLGAAVPGSVRRPVLIGVATGVPAAALVLALVAAHPWRRAASPPAAAGTPAAASIPPEVPTPRSTVVTPPALSPTFLPPLAGGTGQSGLASLAAAASLAEDQVSAAEQRLLSAQRQETAVEAETGSAAVQQSAVQRAQAELTAISAAKAQAQAAAQAAAQALQQDMARQAGIEATLASPAGLTAAAGGIGATSVAAQVQSVEASVWQDASRLEAAEQREGQLQSELTAASLAEQQAVQSADAREAQFAAERTQAQAQVQAAAAALQKAQEEAAAAEAALRQASAACAQQSAVTVAVPASASLSGTAAAATGGGC